MLHVGDRGNWYLGLESMAPKQGGVLKKTVW